MRIQAFLTAAAVNLKRLAAALAALLATWLTLVDITAACLASEMTRARRPTTSVGNHHPCPTAAVSSTRFFNSPSVHWMRNALSYLPKAHQSMAAAALRQAFIQPDRASASQTLRHVADHFRCKWPRLGGFIDGSETDVLTHVDFPAQHRTKIHSTNPIERLNKEVKRRADVVGIFPNEGSIVRLIGAVLLKANDEWQTQSRYMQTEAMAELTPALTDAMPTQISTQAA